MANPGRFHNVPSPADPTVVYTLERVLLYDANGNTLIPNAPAQDALVTGTITASAQTITAPVAGRAEMGITFHGTYAGVKFQVDGSDDGGTTWYALPVLDDSTNIPTNGATDVVPGANATKSYTVEVEGLTHARVRSTAWTSGTANVGITTTAVATAYIPNTTTGGALLTTALSSSTLGGTSKSIFGFLAGNGSTVAGAVATYGWTDDSHVDGVRVATVFKDVAAIGVVTGTPQVVWTPAAGKKFRLLGWELSLSVAGSIIFKFGAGPTTMFRTAALAAGVGVNSPPMGNGSMPGAANDTLQVDVSASGTVTGFVYGTEE